MHLEERLGHSSVQLFALLAAKISLHFTYSAAVMLNSNGQKHHFSLLALVLIPCDSNYISIPSAPVFAVNFYTDCFHSLTLTHLGKFSNSHFSWSYLHEIG
jgi:hypothetical protein